MITNRIMTVDDQFEEWIKEIEEVKNSNKHIIDEIWVKEMLKAQKHLKIGLIYLEELG